MGRRIVVVVAGMVMCLVSGASAKVDKDLFRHRCAVTFSGYEGQETLLNFPALIRIPSGSAIYSAARHDAADICFADADGNLLSHEIDVWNRSGESFIWVKVPMLSGKNTVITLYCGAFTLADVNPREVWREAGYKGVWHFSGSNVDSSPNALVATDSAVPPEYHIVGKVGTAFGSAGSSHFWIANDAKWNGFNGNELTVSAWVKTDSLQTYGRIISCRGTSTSSPGFEFQMQGNSTRFNAITADGTIVSQTAKYISPLNAGADYVYLTAVFKNGTTQIYANGSAVSEASPTVVPAAATQVLKIGGNATSSASDWNGQLDEVRLQWAAQSADWVAADYATQNDSGFAVLGELVDNESLKIKKNEFSYSCRVTFSGYAGSSVLEGFPALVRLPSSLALKCAEDGTDVRVADADGFLVPHEIDTWNPAGESLMWVSVPRLSGRHTELTIFYGGVPTQCVPSGCVWSAAGYRGVWHFSGSNADSSQNAFEALESAVAPTYHAAGRVGTAFSTEGGSYFDVANDVRWAGYNGRGLTVSAWVKTSVSSGYGRVISFRGKGDYGAGVELSMQGNGSKFNAIVCDGTESGRTQCARTIPGNAAEGYVYLTAVYEDGKVQLFADGSAAGEPAAYAFAIPSVTVPLRIGAKSETTSNGWNGQLDEVRLQWAAQSADWVAADYASQNGDAFAVLGIPEALNGFHILIR